MIESSWTDCFDGDCDIEVLWLFWRTLGGSFIQILLDDRAKNVQSSGITNSIQHVVNL